MKNKEMTNGSTKENGKTGKLIIVILVGRAIAVRCI